MTVRTPERYNGFDGRDVLVEAWLYLSHVLLQWPEESQNYSLRHGTSFSFGRSETGTDCNPSSVSKANTNPTLSDIISPGSPAGITGFDRAAGDHDDIVWTNLLKIHFFSKKMFLQHERLIKVNKETHSQMI